MKQSAPLFPVLVQDFFLKHLGSQPDLDAPLLLEFRVNVNSIALWLGHVNPSTTHAYVEADLEMKERTLEKLAPPSRRSRRFRADDRLLAFLNSL
jgi:hypothetical protein